MNLRKRNAMSGENYPYPMVGSAILAGEGYLRTVPDPAWTIVQVGDPDADWRVMPLQSAPGGS